MDKPLPCPFCGGPAEIYRDPGQSDQPPVWLVYCDSCLAQGPDKDKRDAALAAWNRRTSPQR